ncbi:ABC transporter permease [Actinomycetes bacterium]|nr:ABC transporter permease [Actinomycetes bacterium]
MSLKKLVWRFRYLEWSSILFITPAISLFSIFVVYPIFQTIWLSFWKWDRISPGVWVGLENYKKVLSNPEIYSAFSHSLVFVLFYSLIPIVVGLLITLLLLRIKIRGESFFRAILFLPQIISTVVVAISWRWIYAADGPINSLLAKFGAEKITTAWLGNFDTSLIAVGIIGTWINYGLAMILFLSGAQRISQDLLDADRIDGANMRQEFRYILIPSIKGEISIVLIITLTFALRNFDIVWNATQGGPGNSTNVPSLFIYKSAFVNRYVGEAAASSFLLAIVILAVTGLLLLARKESND